MKWTLYFLELRTVTGKPTDYSDIIACIFILLYTRLGSDFPPFVF